MAGSGSGGEDSNPATPKGRDQCALERIEALLEAVLRGKGQPEMPPREQFQRGARKLHEVERSMADSTNRAARCLDSFLGDRGHFKGKNVTRYLREFESKMRVNLIDSATALVGFSTLVEEGILDVVEEIMKDAGGSWEDFSAGMKKEFSTEDEEKLTRATFMTWVLDRKRVQSPMELLREFELKLRLMPTRDSRMIEFRKVETFLEAAGPKMRSEIHRALDLFHPGRDEDDTDWADLVKAVKQVADCRRREEGAENTDSSMQTLVEEVQKLKAMVALPTAATGTYRPPQGPAQAKGEVQTPKPPGPAPEGRTFRCIWCDSQDHSRRDCEDFKVYYKDQIVKFVDKKLAYGDSEELIPTNFGKGGMKEIVDAKRKGKAVATTSYAFAPMSYGIQAGAVEQQADLWRGGRIDRKETRRGEHSTLTEEGQLSLAEHIQGETGWDCPVFISTATASAWRSWEPRRQLRSMAAGETSSIPEPGKEKHQKSEGPSVDLAGEQKGDLEKVEKRKKSFTYGREVDAMCDKSKISNVFWAQELRGLSIGEFFGSIRKDVQEEILGKLRRKKLVKGEGGALVGAVFSLEEEVEDDPIEWEEKEHRRKEIVTAATAVPYQAYVRSMGRWESGEEPGKEVQEVKASNPTDLEDSGIPLVAETNEMCWARGCTTCEIEMRGVVGVVPALLDSGSEINLMSKDIYEAGGWPIDCNCGWEVNSVNDTGKTLWGACSRVWVRVGEVVEPIHIFVHATLPYPVILGQPFITELRMETKVLDDGTHVARLKSRDGRRKVQFPTVRPGDPRTKKQLRDSQPHKEVPPDF